MATNRVELPRGNGGKGVAGFAGAVAMEFSKIDLDRGDAIFALQTPGGPIEEFFPLSKITIDDIDDGPEVWEGLLKAIFDRFKEQDKIPNLVHSCQVSTGNDSTGDPALYVKILVKSTPDIDDPVIAEWNRFANLIQDWLIQLRLPRKPYIQFGEWRRRR